MHLKVHMFYLIGIFFPAVILFIMSFMGWLEGANVTTWFVYSCYGLFMTTYFFVKGVNWELGGCVITNQRLLRFGYKGLTQAVEREILPRSIEDVKVEKKGIFSFFFNTAYIYIYTTNREVDVIRDVIEPEKIRQAYAEMIKAYDASRNSSVFSGAVDENSEDSRPNMHSELNQQNPPH